MGLYLNMAVVVHDWLSRHGGAGSAVTLGVQDMGFPTSAFLKGAGLDATLTLPPSMTADAFFKLCGYAKLSALDVSAYEGADLVHDLNNSDLPMAAIAAFDLVYNGGTLEHVFDVATALDAMTRMLKPGGLILHASPCNNWIDHGFYQISPTLYFDYCAAAGFEVLEAAAFFYQERNGGDPLWEVRPLQPGTFGAGLSGAADDRTVQILLLAQKSGEAHVRPQVTQALYADDPTRSKPVWFAPFDMRDGARLARAAPQRLVPTRFVREEGQCWLADLPLPPGDGMADPLRSQLMVFEDQTPLGPGHASHRNIRRRGLGAFAHWENMLMLSTSDNSDPNTNGRVYEVVLPALRGL